VRKTDAENSIKVQKYFSDCGVMSRRAAEEAIKKGLVRVNGEVVSEGERIIPGVDLVEYNGVPVIPSADKKTYVLLNKPRGFVTTLSDEKGRRTVAELVANVGTRIYPVGRLDMDSDGLLLFTDDGELTNKLTHPRHEIPKIYHVTVSGKVSCEKIDALSSPMIIDGYKILPVKTRVIDEGVSSSTLEMTLYEGRNRQIRKMCQQQNLKITRLCRVAIGNIRLGSLAVGKWRYLTPAEVAYLKES
jgi:23S rRNA pseudouridine2605 synthase